MTITEMVNQYVAQHGIQKDDMAEKMGVSRTQFYAKLRGDSEFSLSEAYALANMMGVSVDDINAAVVAK